MPEDLGPFHNRPAEWALYQPLVGRTMLELGGKINAPPEARSLPNSEKREYTYKAFFERLGYQHISVDWNGDHGALPLDLRVPLNLGTFDMVSNIGTSEHVEDQEGVWRNLVAACAPASVLVSTTPLAGGQDWQWHGYFYPTAQFFTDLADLNGFRLDRLYENGEVPRRMTFCRMTRLVVLPFSMPVGNMYRNVP